MQSEELQKWQITECRCIENWTNARDQLNLEKLQRPCELQQWETNGAYTNCCKTQFVRFLLKNFKSNVSIERFETFVNYLMRWFECNYFVLLAQIVDRLHARLHPNFYATESHGTWCKPIEPLHLVVFAFSLTHDSHKEIPLSTHWMHFTAWVPSIHDFPTFPFLLFLSRMSEKAAEAYADRLS